MKQKSFTNNSQEVLLNLILASNFIRQHLEKHSSSFGLSLQQYNILRILRGVYPDGHPCAAIRERMLDRAPDLTRRLNALSKMGYVERRRDPADRRIVLSRITEAGLELLSEMQQGADEAELVAAQTLTSEERDTLSRLCEKIY